MRKSTHPLGIRLLADSDQGGRFSGRGEILLGSQDAPLADGHLELECLGRGEGELDDRVEPGFASAALSTRATNSIAAVLGV